MAPAPYLLFDGDCAEALTFYAEVLGGRVTLTRRYSAMPGAPLPWRRSLRVMHGEVSLPRGILMGSDGPPGAAPVRSDPPLVLHATPDRAVAAVQFARLSDGGTVIEEFRPTHFAPGFGMLRDRFGIRWCIAASVAGARVAS